MGREIFKIFPLAPSSSIHSPGGLYEFANSGQLKNPELIAEALKATQATLEKVSPTQRGTVLDTIAHLQYVSGDRKGALESARQAAAAPGASPDAQTSSRKLKKELQK